MLSTRSTIYMNTKFWIDNIPIENHQLHNMYWMHKMQKKLLKARFIMASLSLLELLARTVTSIFCLLFRQILLLKINRFFTGIKTFWVKQNNKPVIDVINKLNQCSQATPISSFDFSTLYIKVSHNKILMVLFWWRRKLIYYG